jgi:hypothetical protein
MISSTPISLLSVYLPAIHILEARIFRLNIHDGPFNGQFIGRLTGRKLKGFIPSWFKPTSHKPWIVISGWFSEALIYLAESETGLTRFCDLIGGYLYLANQV